MTIQRRYSLPNCTLVIEGLNDGTARPTEVRPLLSMLVNAECHFTNSHQPPLTGGRDFFENLVTAVSAYAQEVLSNVQHPEAHKMTSCIYEAFTHKFFRVTITLDLVLMCEHTSGRIAGCCAPL